MHRTMERQHVKRLYRSAFEPVILSAIAGGGQVTLRWIGTPNDSNYNLYVTTDSGRYDASPTVTVAGTYYTYVGLDNGVTYYFTVTAGQLGEESAPSNEVSATPRRESVLRR